MIRCAEALSTVRNTDAALDEVISKLNDGLGGEPGDLAFVFATMHHADALDRIGRTLRDRGLGRVVMGCTCESVVGEGREIEATTGLSAWSARLPGVAISPFYLDGNGGETWPEAAGSEPSSAVILLGDPFGFSADGWFGRLATARPGVRVLGGMASGGSAPGQNRLILNGESRTTGAVAVALRGDLTIRSVVSQGCRPIGRPLIVTKVDGNIVRELGRRPALEVLQEIFETLDPDDRKRVRSGLNIGRVISEYRDAFGRGDFLVRNVMGADQAGGIAISDLVRVGQTVQFHVRDAETADEDLRQLIAKDRESGPVAGALLFTCNGRGSRLFPGPDHDVSVLRELLGPIPVAGFFAMGELGPVGGENFVHGFTASVVLFGESS